MNLQQMYEDLQKQLNDKLTAIKTKKNEIVSLQAEANKLQGALEMLVYVSNGVNKDKDQEDTENTTNDSIEQKED